MNQTVKEIGKKIVGLLPTKMWLSYRFKKKMGYPMDWKNPKTYNEKLQWLKLYDKNPFYTTLVDKYEVKKYIAEKFGEEYIIPTLGVWNSFDEIDFDALPDQFVLKCTHDSGGVLIVRDKAKFDKKSARKMFRVALNRNNYSVNREWPYKNVKPRIIAETYMEDEKTTDLKDYKFFCFGGEAKALLIASDREHDLRMDFFDRNFEHLPFRRRHDNAEITPSKPEGFESMLELAEKMAQGLTHVRVDLYNVSGKIYFGELTFFPAGGLGSFDPFEWDYTFGEWIALPEKG